MTNTALEEMRSKRDTDQKIFELSEKDAVPTEEQVIDQVHERRLLMKLDLALVPLFMLICQQIRLLFDCDSNASEYLYRLYELRGSVSVSPINK